MDNRDVEKANEIRDRLDAEAAAEKGSEALNIALGIIGAAAGGVVGYFVFYWIWKQGYNVSVLPGTLLGLGGGLLLRQQSMLMSIICGVGGLAIGVVSQWRVLYQYEEFGFFLSNNVSQLPWQVLLGLAAGTLLAAWFGRGRDSAFRT